VCEYHSVAIKRIELVKTWSDAVPAGRWGVLEYWIVARKIGIARYWNTTPSKQFFDNSPIQ
jgi:hypothetical protein